ncbi:anthranilate synthase component I [Thermomicrobium sp. 4228-Ro]|uniref:anthranilate synthase component I n=1 Tax=Thermomicrobium sp. 4228-Ro TaxID=2993937 RepID=UPI00224950D0|nr:anthranilate synthase component I [Thermomicrobium sp. 4228-Ro]MCX2726741.1 anthranilate synthase component I [Thermomicrobium sp. 4228-Ro]
MSTTTLIRSSPQRYRPSFEEVAALAQQATVIPVYRELDADLETPVSAFLKVAQGPYAFLLESVEGGERLARYSFIGTDPFLVVELDDGIARLRSTGVRETLAASALAPFGGADYYGHPAQEQRVAFEDPLRFLADLLGRYRTVHLPDMPRFLGGAVGYLGYETIRYFEPRVPAAPQDTLGLPDAVFLFVDSMLVFDHLERTIAVVSHVHVADGMPLERAYAEAVERIERLVDRLRRQSVVPVGNGPVDPATVEQRVRPHLDRATYVGMVERAKEYIAAGDIIQVVLSQRQEVETGAHPFTIYRALRRINPSPYMYYLRFGDDVLIGASPEMLVRVDGRILSTHPIAGTRRRGRTPEEDAALAEELATDEKERAEHIMLVDLARNDIGRVAAPGTVHVPRLMTVERFSHVMHLVSEVTGVLCDDLSALDALRSCFPAGTVSGAPKIRAMEIIAELEQEQRGPYAGAVGYVDFSGNLDTAITLRTIVMRGQQAFLQAGAGIVADSVPEREHQECHHKMRALIRAIEHAEQMEREQRGSTV